MADVVAWMTLEPGANDFTDTLVPYKFCSDEYAGRNGIAMYSMRVPTL